MATVVDLLWLIVTIAFVFLVDCWILVFPGGKKDW